MAALGDGGAYCCVPVSLRRVRVLCQTVERVALRGIERRRLPVREQGRSRAITASRVGRHGRARPQRCGIWGESTDAPHQRSDDGDRTRTNGAQPIRHPVPAARLLNLPEHTEVPEQIRYDIRGPAVLMRSRFGRFQLLAQSTAGDRAFALSQRMQVVDHVVLTAAHRRFLNARFCGVPTRTPGVRRADPAKAERPANHRKATAAGRQQIGTQAQIRGTVPLGCPIRNTVAVIASAERSLTGESSFEKLPPVQALRPRRRTSACRQRPCWIRTGCG